MSYPVSYPLLIPMSSGTDEYDNACRLFVETVDYSEYIHKHGCAFDGHFTCCHGVNHTMLDTYANEQCNMTDVCHVQDDNDAVYIISGFIVMMGVLLCFLALHMKDTRTRIRLVRELGEEMGLVRQVGESAPDFEMRCMAEKREKLRVYGSF